MPNFFYAIFSIKNSPLAHLFHYHAIRLMQLSRWTISSWECSIKIIFIGEIYTLPFLSVRKIVFGWKLDSRFIYRYIILILYDYFVLQNTIEIESKEDVVWHSRVNMSLEKFKKYQNILFPEDILNYFYMV